MLRISALIFIIFSSFASNASQIDIRGDYTQGGLLEIYLNSGDKAYLNGNKKQVHNGNKVIVSFGRSAGLKHSLRILTKAGQQSVIPINISKREYETQSIEGIASKYVAPKKGHYERIAKEAKIIKKAKAKNSKICYLDEKWLQPSSGVISGVFGSQRIFNGVPKRPHYGLDIANKEGTPINAPKSGLVTLVHQDMFYTGKTVMISHGCNISSILIHMSSINVKQGDAVKQGQKVGEIGTTGRSTGPHLHWGVYHKKTAIDPALLLD